MRAAPPCPGWLFVLLAVVSSVSCLRPAPAAALRPTLRAPLARAQLRLCAEPPRGFVVPTAAAPGAAVEEYEALSLSSMQNGESAIVALMAVFAYIFGGVIFYWQSVPAWSLTDAFYFVAVTLSSVGYGDLTPEGDWLKLFTAAYILIGVAILGTALGEVVSSLLEVDAETPASRALEWLTGAGKGAELEGESCDGRRELCDVDLLMAGGGDAIGDLLRTLGTVGVTIGAGSAAFLYFDESRSSSLVDALYSSVVTLTTVGYGDIVPESSTARTFVGVYSLFGSMSMSNHVHPLWDLASH